MSTLCWLGLPEQDRQVAESLYRKQPATADALAARTGLPPARIRRALSALRRQGLLHRGAPLRDGRPGYVWLDVAPAARRAREAAA